MRQCCLLGDYMKTGTNRNPSATKSGPGRYHKQGYKKTKKSLTKAK